MCLKAEHSCGVKRKVAVTTSPNTPQLPPPQEVTQLQGPQVALRESLLLHGSLMTKHKLPMLS